MKLSILKILFLTSLLLLLKINKVNSKTDDLSIKDDEDDDDDDDEDITPKSKSRSSKPTSTEQKSDLSSSSSKENTDEDKPKHQPKTSTSQKYEIDDEFDDPDLLKSKKSKPKTQNQGKKDNLPHKNTTESTETIPDSISKKKKFMNIFENYEVVMIGILIIYILNVIYGKITNQNLANLWHMKNKSFFEENYAHMGGEKDYNPKSQNLLMKESYNQFKFFASGRVYSNWMLVSIETKKRHDLVNMLGSMFLFPEKDKILYEFSINPTSELPIIFCLCKKINVKLLKSTYEEIDKFCEPSEVSFVKDNVVLLTENTEIVENIFKNKELFVLYKKIEKYIDFVFYTDKRNSDKRDKNMLAFSYDVTNMLDKDSDDLFNLTLFAHYLVDILCTITLKSTYKKEAENRRIEYDAQKSRELAEKNAEEIKNKKEEEKNAKSNKKLTVEQAQKLEEKERKEAIKNQNKKRFKILKN